MTAKAAKTLWTVALYLCLLFFGFAIAYSGCWMLETIINPTVHVELLSVARTVWSVITSLIAMAFYHQASREMPDGPTDRPR